MSKAAAFPFADADVTSSRAEYTKITAKAAKVAVITASVIMRYSYNIAIDDLQCTVLIFAQHSYHVTTFRAVMHADSFRPALVTRNKILCYIHIANR